MRPHSASTTTALRPDRGRALCAGVTLCCLLWTLGTGILLGIKSARPTLGVRSLPMQALQPLHTLGVVCFLASGVLALYAVAMRRVGARCSPETTWGAAALGIFFVSAAIGTLAGYGSGLEYISWPLALTPLPLGVFAVTWWGAWRSIGPLASRAPEGAWLLLVGLTLTPLGLVERLLGLQGEGATRSLMVEWHALDTVFAGFNTSLYGLGVLLAARPGRGVALRSPLLFGVAAFAMVSTFGHHHYVSGQPYTLKLIALGASMLGMVSFVRHARAFRRSHRVAEAGPGAPLMHTGALWTLFAVGSGVALAEPHVNLLLHGTHAIVAHSMGAVIGVNVAIVLGALLEHAPGSATERHMRRRTVQRTVRVLNVVLALMVVDLFAAGVAKGILRLDGSHHEYLPVVRALLIPLPLLGLALAAALLRLTLLIVRARPSPAPAPAAPVDPAGPDAPGAPVHPPAPSPHARVRATEVVEYETV